MKERITLICPHCGKLLEIPGDLEEFACLYCGKRTQTALVVQGTDTDYDVRRETLRKQLPLTVTRYPDYYKKIAKKDYFSALECYEQENLETLGLLELCAATCPQGQEALLREAAKEVLDALDAVMHSDSRWENARKRTYVLYERKVVLALFLCVLADKMQLECSSAFGVELHEQWMARYPKEKWTPAQYKIIAEGFKRGRLCYITTAICREQGKPDDCAELTALRVFRDGYLRQSEGGEALIERYYELAPGLLTCMDYCDDAAAVCALLREEYLQPCLRALEQGRQDDCRSGYIAMVDFLCSRYSM